MEGLQDISLEQACDLLLKAVQPITKAENVPLEDALGRVLAENVAAPIDNPPFPRSPLDGYAFAASASAGASAEHPVELRIVGEECAGDYFAGHVGAGEAVRLMTGARIPAGCDTVIRQEDVRVEGDRLFVPYALQPYQNYCYAGEDIRKGTIAAAKGTRLNAGHIGRLASLGFAEVKVCRMPRIVLASTGDELLMPGEPLRPGKIYNSNLYLLAARLREFGFSSEVLGVLPDDVEQAAEVLRPWGSRADLVLTTGGVSVGKKDIMHGVVAAIGHRLFWRVAMKPGAPAIAYKVGGTLGIALSGNPFACFATFEMLARPVLARLAHREDLSLRETRGVLGDAFPKASRGRRFVRAHFNEDTGVVDLPDQHASGALSELSRCNAFVEFPAGTPACPAGTGVKVFLL